MKFVSLSRNNTICINIFFCGNSNDTLSIIVKTRNTLISLLVFTRSEDMEYFRMIY